MLATEIDPSIGSKFPESTKITADMSVEVSRTEAFETDEGYKGVKVTDKDGKFFHSTVPQIVSLLLGEKVAEKIRKASDGALTIFFKNVQNDPKHTKRAGTHLEGSYFP